jgi:hypothetical protein
MNVLPSCCFPSAHWLSLASTDAVIDIHENYVKQTFRNRFEIAGVNGKISLTIPIESQNGKKTPTKDIRIARGSWQKQHLRSIRASYGRAPYFEHYYPDLESIFLEPEIHLIDFNVSALDWIKLTGYHASLHYSESFIVEGEQMNDYRSLFEPSSPWTEVQEYLQVFSDRHPFMQKMSAIDLVMNLGPELNTYLRSIGQISKPK